MKVYRILILLLTLSGTTLGQTNVDFCKPKKWILEGYIYWGITFSPEETEKNDYLNFKEDGTFISVDEGKLENGTWKWKPGNKSLILEDAKTGESSKLTVITCTKTTLVVLIQDEDDGIKIKFRALHE